MTDTGVSSAGSQTADNCFIAKEFEFANQAIAEFLFERNPKDRMARAITLAAWCEADLIDGNCSKFDLELSELLKTFRVELYSPNDGIRYYNSLKPIVEAKRLKLKQSQLELSRCLIALSALQADTTATSTTKAGIDFRKAS